MKNKLLSKCISYIRKNNPNYSEEKLAEIKYGLESIYILITKTIAIFTIAFLLNILKEVIIFTLIYNLIRMPSFGLHATKSWMCLLSSAVIFIVTPYICVTQEFSFTFKSIAGIITILLIIKNAPADTYKRPIINPIRRRNYKIISTILAIIMVTIALIIENSFLSNCLIFALIIQCIMISPYVYKIFHLPYNNYKQYIYNN